MFLQFSKDKEKQIVKQINPQRSRHSLLHLHVSLWREPHNVPRCKWILVFVVSSIIIRVYISSSTVIDLTFRQLGYEGGRITFAGTDRVKHCGIKINAIEEKDNGEWKWVRIQYIIVAHCNIIATVIATSRWHSTYSPCLSTFSFSLWLSRQRWWGIGLTELKTNIFHTRASLQKCEQLEVWIGWENSLMSRFQINAQFFVNAETTLTRNIPCKSFHPSSSLWSSSLSSWHFQNHHTV